MTRAERIEAAAAALVDAYWNPVKDWEVLEASHIVALRYALESKDDPAPLRDAAAALIREIQARDGEGNTIPAHTYSLLSNLIRAAGGQV